MNHILVPGAPGERPKTAVVLTPSEWNRMSDQLEEVRRRQETEEARALMKKERHERSVKMTQNWPSTMASLKKDRERRFEEAARKDKEKKQKLYDDIIERRNKEKSEVLERAKKLIYDSTDGSKTLMSGLILSNVLEERRRQIELKGMLREKQQEKKAKEVVDLKRKTKEFEEFVQHEKMEMAQKKERTKQMLNEQLEENQEKHRAWLKKKEDEALDNEVLQKELDDLAEMEKADRVALKEKIRQDQEQFKKMDDHHKEQKRQQEKEQDEMNSIYCHIRDKLEKQRKEKERQIHEDMIKNREKLAFRIVQLPDYTQEEEEQRVAIEQREERYRNELKLRAEKKHKLQQELLKFQDESEKAAEREGKLLLEERRWDLLQRLALDEATKEWNQKEAERIVKNKMKIRRDLLNQWREKDENDLRVKLSDIKQAQIRAAEDHTELLRRCEDTVKYAAEEHLPLYPIEAAIVRVKKDAGLIDDKKDITFLRSRVPIKSVAVYDQKSQR